MGIREDSLGIVLEHFDAAVDVIPSPHVRADQPVPQDPHDELLLGGVPGPLVQHLDLNFAARDTYCLLQ